MKSHERAVALSGKTWVAADNLYYEDGKLYWINSPKYDIPAGSEAGSKHIDGYWEVKFQGKRMLRHRVVYYMHTGEWPDLIDHIDRDRSNDRFENLRPSNKSLNGHNSDKPLGTNQYRGVSFNKRDNKFEAYIKINRKRKFLGYHDTAEQAHEAFLNYRKEVVQHVR